MLVMPLPPSIVRRQFVGGFNAKVDANANVNAGRTKSLPALTPSMSMKNMRGKDTSSLEGSMEGSSSSSQQPPGATGSAAGPMERRNLSPQKIFNKLTRPDKMGFLEGATLLKEEASRLSMADTVMLRRARDKNSILEDRISQWMLNGIQQQQAERAATRSTSILPHDPTIWGAAAASIHTSERESSSNYSPSKALPFDDYYKLLKMHNEGSPGRSPSRGPGHSPETKATDAKATEGKTTENKSPEGKTVRIFEPNDPPYAPPAPAAPIAASPVASTAPLAPLGPPLNLLKHFAEHDKRFDAYVKIRQLEQPSAKLFAKMTNSKLLKPKRVKRMAPLGKEAVQLMDSRGKASRLASKGFVNVFKAASKKGKRAYAAGQEEEEEASSSSDSDSEAEGEDGAIDRLDSLELEEDSSIASSTTHTTLGHIPGTPGSHAAPLSPGTSSSGPPSRSLGKTRSSSRRRLLHSDSMHAGGSNSQSPGSKRRHAGGQEDHLDEILYPPIPEAELDLQAKLQATWDCFQLPATDRLAFMTKYSTQAYASELGRAIDLWAEAAVHIVMFRQALALRKKAFSNALSVASSKAKDLLEELFRKLPPILASRSPLLLPLTSVHERGMQVEPLSATAVHELRGMIRDFIFSITAPVANASFAVGNANASFSIGNANASFSIKSSMDAIGARAGAKAGAVAVGGQGAVQGAEDAMAQLLQRKMSIFAREAGTLAISKIEQVERVFGDQIHVNTRPAKDWVLGHEVMKGLDAIET